VLSAPLRRLLAIPDRARKAVGRRLLDATGSWGPCAARFSTLSLRAAQEETGSAIPAVGYPAPSGITAVLVLISGYLALFL
jgi:hypothetical protein